MLIPKLTPIVVLLLGLMLSAGILPASAMPILSIEPSSLTVQTGQDFSLGIKISGVTDLYDFQFDLAFDHTILSATSVTEGSFLPGCGFLCFSEGMIDNSAGTITAIANTLAGPISGVNGSGTLATVNFHALALGTSPITLSNVILEDSTPADITADTMNGTVQVVPEPSTLLLLATGFVGLLGYGWRQRKKAA